MRYHNVVGHRDGQSYSFMGRTLEDERVELWNGRDQPWLPIEQVDGYRWELNQYWRDAG